MLAIKDNQPKLLAHVRPLFDRSERQLYQDLSVSYWETYDEDHGRSETRRYWTTDQVADFPQHQAWKGLRLFGMVEAERRIGAQVTVERRYYISSLDNDAHRFGEAVRGHWGIENSLHGVLDVVFREDDSRIRKGHAPGNMAVLRQMANSFLPVQRRVTRQPGDLAPPPPVWDLGVAGRTWVGLAGHERRRLSRIYKSLVFLKRVENFREGGGAGTVCAFIFGNYYFCRTLQRWNDRPSTRRVSSRPSPRAWNPTERA